MIYTIFVYFSSIMIILLSRINSLTRLKFICLIFTIYSAVRYDYGYDYFNYIHIILNQEYGRFEFLQRKIAELSFYTNPQIFFIINSVLVCFFIYKIYYNLHDKMPMLLIGFCMIFMLPIGFHLSLDRVRQFTSIFLLLYATTLSTTRNRILFYILAVFCHYASLIFLPFILFKSFFSKSMPWFLQISFFLLSVFIFPQIFIQLLSLLGRYSSYINYLSNDGNKILYLYAIILTFLILNYGLIKQNMWALYYYNLMFFGVCFYFALSSFGVHLTRITAFLLLPTPIVIGYILSFKNRAYQYGCIFVMVLITLVLHYFAYQNENRDALNNYDLFFLYDVRSYNQ